MPRATKAKSGSKRSLAEYERKRDFSKTREPSGRRSKAKAKARRRHPRFSFQKHSATSEHYDLRLEVDGVMRSWAVPRGPSMDPAVKRLAVQVEDHDLDANVTETPPRPDGHGAIVWDRGSYEQGGRVRWPEALERGHAVFVLHGEKLEGGFALQRTGRGDPPQWLLIKRRDEWARPGSDIAVEQPESVISGRRLGDAG
jgi:DNA ligase D-like protein (predicted 3'-phosphoesterase)